MANPKYFHVQHLPTATSHLVRALKAEQATAAVYGAQAPAKPATDEQIAAYFAGDGALHAASSPEGTGRFFLVQTVENDPEAVVLVRAKNGPAAVAAVTAGAYKTEVASQEELVKLLVQGLKPIDAVPSAKDAKAGEADTASQAAPAQTAHAEEPALA